MMLDTALGQCQKTIRDEVNQCLCGLKDRLGLLDGETQFLDVCDDVCSW
jgi:hypothetical protein